MNDFLSTIYGKAIAVLTIIALLFGIGAEGVVMYRNAMEGKTAAETAHNAALQKEAEARLTQQKAEIELQTAKNAERLKKAEADKLEAEARAAVEIAHNAALQKESDAKLAQQKAAIELETARNAERFKRAEAEKMEADAIKAKADADSAKSLAEINRNNIEKSRSEALIAAQKSQILGNAIGPDRDKSIQQQYHRSLESVIGAH